MRLSVIRRSCFIGQNHKKKIDRLPLDFHDLFAVRLKADGAIDMHCPSVPYPHLQVNAGQVQFIERDPRHSLGREVSDAMTQHLGMNRDVELGVLRRDIHQKAKADQLPSRTNRKAPIKLISENLPHLLKSLTQQGRVFTINTEMKTITMNWK